VGKSFIKNYIACVLQIAVIVVMFMVYVAMQRYFGNVANGFAQTKLIQFVVLISLGLAVVKSGTWSRKVCGIG
jgi:archaellum component FlaF (FlaF/FlaG flagellin family)